ncbi:MAG: hypothetical protein M3O20_07670 [Acidobacteriota bacterium]|nr:hypothetical protein [Acidobacteriota bacterium]
MHELHRKAAEEHELAAKAHRTAAEDNEKGEKSKRINMPARCENGSHCENHQRAAELHDCAAYAHRSAAEQPKKQDPLTSQQRSSQAREHSRSAFERSVQAEEADVTDAAHPRVSN